MHVSANSKELKSISPQTTSSHKTQSRLDCSLGEVPGSFSTKTACQDGSTFDEQQAETSHETQTLQVHEKFVTTV